MEPKAASLRNHIILAIVLLFVDAFMIGQGMLAIFLICIVSPLLLIRLLFALRRPSLRAYRLRLLVVYLIAGIVIILIVRLNNEIASARLLKLAIACDVYRGQRGKYPETLQELVPNFIPSLPRAKYVFSDSGFHYIALGNRHSIYYVKIPPFGRESYVLEEQKVLFTD